ncbi:MAG: hypothetical protein ABSF11_13350 [Methylocella sp.]
MDRDVIVAEDSQLNPLQSGQNIGCREKTLQQRRANPATPERLANSEKDPARVALTVAERLQPAISHGLAIDIADDLEFRLAKTIEPDLQILDRGEALHGGAEMLKSLFVEQFEQRASVTFRPPPDGKTIGPEISRRRGGLGRAYRHGLRRFRQA